METLEIKTLLPSCSTICIFVFRGLKLIPTYKDGRFRTTLKTTLEAIKQKQNIVIFPENSDNGYHDELVGFHPGFVLLLELAKKQNIDLNIVVAYLNKTETNLFLTSLLKRQLCLKHIQQKKKLQAQ